MQSLLWACQKGLVAQKSRLTLAESAGRGIKAAVALRIGRCETADKELWCMPGFTERGLRLTALFSLWLTSLVHCLSPHLLRSRIVMVLVTPGAPRRNYTTIFPMLPENDISPPALLRGLYLRI